MRDTLRAYTVTVTLPGCEGAPVVPAGVTEALERCAPAWSASGLMSAWGADRTVVAMTVRAPSEGPARGAALNLVAQACKGVLDVTKATATAEPVTEARLSAGINGIQSRF